MGYESRLYVVDKHENINYGEVIGFMNMSKMGYNFYKIFTKEIDFDMYDTDGNTILKEDNCGDTLTYINPDIVINKLNEMIKSDNYRRLKPMRNWLISLNDEKWKNLVVVHYGY